MDSQQSKLLEMASRESDPNRLIRLVEEFLRLSDRPKRVQLCGTGISNVSDPHVGEDLLQP